MVGIHCIYDINDIPNEIINDSIQLKDFFEKICVDNNLTVINKMFHAFTPYGFTGIFLLSESHLSFHTWPENNSIYIDIFSCNTNLNTSKLLNDILEYFKTNKYKMKILDR